MLCCCTVALMRSDTCFFSKTVLTDITQKKDEHTPRRQRHKHAHAHNLISCEKWPQGFRDQSRTECNLVFAFVAHPCTGLTSKACATLQLRPGITRMVSHQQHCCSFTSLAVCLQYKVPWFSSVYPKEYVCHVWVFGIGENWLNSRDREAIVCWGKVRVSHMGNWRNKMALCVVLTFSVRPLFFECVFMLILFYLTWSQMKNSEP